MPAAHAAQASLARAQPMRGGGGVAAAVMAPSGSAARSGTAVAARPVSAQWLRSVAGMRRRFAGRCCVAVLTMVAMVMGVRIRFGARQRHAVDAADASREAKEGEPL
ncbi:MAG TPA: hypothetical protein VEX14_17865 [Burkholderiaceae bacterium]|nr:hypothetical protein [Burkholderiaceae bacterium]